MNNTKPQRFDLKDPVILSLAERYNLKPFFVAYLRAAMKTGIKTYNRDELIEHIYQDLPRRFSMIQDVIARTDIDDTLKSIKVFRLARDNKLRLEVVEFLKTVEEDVLNDLCK